MYVVEYKSILDGLGGAENVTSIGSIETVPLSGLKPGHTYNVTVYTSVDGIKSAPNMVPCTTGRLHIHG